MNEVVFVIPGRPVGKERPRVVQNDNGKSVAYTPRKTKDYESLVRLVFLQKANGKVFEGAIRVEILAVFEKSKAYGDEQNTDSKFCRNRPDADNIEKAVLDGLNGVAWKDDASIVDLHIQKRYGDKAQVMVCISDVK
ncbi:MAG: RusA family crossover junction endodeoxyribonuclease [Clostridia bacterium]|nr:RusA family crossover junction endodeoxyribonuclease [Clostridia bacterium]